MGLYGWRGWSGVAQSCCSAVLRQPEASSPRVPLQKGRGPAEGPELWFTGDAAGRREDSHGGRRDPESFILTPASPAKAPAVPAPDQGQVRLFHVWAPSGPLGSQNIGNAQRGEPGTSGWSTCGVVTPPQRRWEWGVRRPPDVVSTEMTGPLEPWSSPWPALLTACGVPSSQEPGWGVAAGGTAAALDSGSPGEIFVCLTTTGTTAGPRRP